MRPQTFAYTARSWSGSGFGSFGVRVTSLEGAIRVQMLDGAVEPARRLTPDGLFEVAREVLSAPGTADISYDAATGLPTTIRASGPPNVMDADTNIDVSDFVAGPDIDAKRVRQAITWALSDWSKGEPASFAYTWTRTAASALAPETVFTVARESSRAPAFTPATTATGAESASVASVPATLRAASTALAGGAWVDLTLEPGNGVPLLMAVDPSSAPGDAYWIALSFSDIEREQQTEAFRVARERWSAAGLTRYRYVWTYRGEAGTYTYRVTMRGDVSHLLRAKGSAVLWQAIDVGPRLDVLFDQISRQLHDGGRVVATYDPTFGYPLTVTLRSVNGAPSGTVVISDFAVE